MEKNDFKNLIPRKERHKKMIEESSIPESTNSRIIIPCLDRSFGFKTNEYAKHSQKIDRYIDKVSFEKFVRQANRIVDRELLHKAKKQTQPFFRIISFLLKLSIALAILTFTILSFNVYTNFGEENENIILNVSIVLIVISVVIAGLCPVFLYRSVYHEYNHEAKIKQNLEKFAEQQNQANEAAQKDYLKWKFQEDIFWIELIIDQCSYEYKTSTVAPNRFKITDSPPLID